MKLLSTLLAAIALSATVRAEDPAPATEKPAEKPAGGEKGKPNPEAAFKKMDKDGDGNLTLEEFKANPRAQKDPAKAEARYKKIDKDSDGKVTLDEFKAGMQPPAGGGKGKGKGKEGGEKKPQ